MKIQKFKKPKLITKFLSIIKKSCLKNNNISSTRISSYIILFTILLFCVYFLTMSVYIVIYNVNATIPNETIIIFASLLAHQLSLLGINKFAETKQINNNNNNNSFVEEEEIL